MQNLKDFTGRPISPTSIESESARFMSRVYAWMTAGVCLSGALAYMIGQKPEVAASIVTNRPLFWGLIIAQLGAVFYLSLAISSRRGRD